MKLIKLILVIILFATPCYAGSLAGIVGGGAAISPTPIGYVGDQTSRTVGTAYLGGDVFYCMSYTANATGKLGYGYVQHKSTSAERVRIAVYTDSTNGAGDPNNETLIGVSDILITNADDTTTVTSRTGELLGGSVVSGTHYFVCVIGSSGGANIYKDSTAGNTKRSKTLTGGYNSPPSLSSTGWSDTTSTQHGTYVDIINSAISNSANVLVDFETGSDGDLLSVANLITSTRGGTTEYNVQWTLTGGQTCMKIATAGQENLHTPRTLNNAIYADASSTRGLKLDASIQTAVAAYKMITFSTKASIGFFLKAPDTSGNSYHYGLVYIQNLAGTQAGGLNIWTGNMHLEGNGGGPYGSAYTYTPNAWYWITILYDAGTGGGTFTIAAYETSTWTQVWTATVGSMGTSAPYILEFGRQDWSAGEAGTPFLFYFDNFVLDYTNGTFPMLP